MASNEKSRNVRLPNIVEALLPIVVMMGLMIYGLNFTNETYVDAHMPLAVSIVVACIVGCICGHSFSDMLAGMVDRLNATMVSAVVAASTPLWPAGPPQRSSACCSSSTVSTPKITGTGLSTLSAVTPCVTLWHT